jgi:hypothetical protein
MAGLADMLVQTELQHSTDVPDFAGSIQKGTELAQHAEQVKQQRAALEQKKQELEMSKLDKIANLYKVGSEMTEGRSRNIFLGTTVPNAIKALGWGDKIHPDNQQILSVNPDVAKVIAQSGASPAEVAQILADPEKMAPYASKNKIEQVKATDANAPVTPGIQVPDQLDGAMNKLRTELRYGGKINLGDLQDPAKRQAFLNRSGLDGDTLNEVMNTFPKGLADAEKEGIQNQATRQNALLRNSSLDDRTRNQLVLQTQAQVNKDPTLVNFDQRAVGARRLIGLANDALSSKDPESRIKKTQQLMNSIAQEEAALVSGKSNFAEGTVEEARYSNAAAELKTLKDKFSSLFTSNGTVTDVKELTSAIKNAKVMARELGARYASDIDERFDTLSAGAIPEQQTILDSKRQAYKHKFNGAFSNDEKHYSLSNGKSYSADEIRAMLRGNAGLRDKIDPKILKEVESN